MEIANNVNPVQYDLGLHLSDLCVLILRMFTVFLGQTSKLQRKQNLGEEKSCEKSFYHMTSLFFSG